MAHPVIHVHPDYRGVLQHISNDELCRRMEDIRLVLTDNDGVLTDTGVYYSDRGEELKRYSIRDGMGIQRLRERGLKTGIITGEVSKNLARRAEKLRIDHLELGVQDKLDHLKQLMARTGCELRHIAFIGDDVNDLGLMHAIKEFGFIASPGDAIPMVRSIVHYICEHSGGHGAFREFAEVILHLRHEA